MPNDAAQAAKCAYRGKQAQVDTLLMFLEWVWWTYSSELVTGRSSEVLVLEYLAALTEEHP